MEEEIKIEPFWVAGSERPQDQVVEAGQEDVVPHHEEESLRDPPEGLNGEGNYIVKVPREDDQEVRGTYFLPTAISPGWRSTLFSLAKSSSAGAMS